MARFFVNVNTVVAVDLDDSFLSEHDGNLDVIADEIANYYFAGDCEVLDECLVDLAPENDPESAYSF
jgi:hypothetical protein